MIGGAWTFGRGCRGRSSDRDRSGTPGARTAPLRAVLQELLVVAGLLFGYRFGRLVVAHPSRVAIGNATHLLACERALRLPNELLLQHLLLSSVTATRLANIYYVAVHFPLTAGFLVWLFVRARREYFRIRTTLALLTGLALVIHAAFPLAPARMLHRFGFVDTAAMYGPSVYSSAPATDHVANQFAAMPSLHFGWAVVVALGVIRIGRSRMRWLWIAHPIITLLVIVGTGNHYWADAVVAGILLVFAEAAVRVVWSAGLLPRPAEIHLGQASDPAGLARVVAVAGRPTQQTRDSSGAGDTAGARAPPAGAALG